MNNNIAKVTNPENGEVTLYLRNSKGGPVVTGKNLTEAMIKWQHAYVIYRIAQDYPELLAPFED